ncbi:eukaryotic integral membrane protein-domain-containing protein [Leucosporidium creatinivorum]|uniref:Eukaryotic integral membrane protein-domain-containing protein n=1 Tax=Leucosporidium creatinivorum TaxID=106004 RepID=A0A1Y2ESF9_9BASI|nr:eukaryotic integral membrane protein-domain-containing protein [Leucosporidium creatinivorum]
MSSITLPTALLSLPPATRALTGALFILSSLLFVLRLSLDPKDIKGIFGASGDNTLVFPWLVLLPGNVVWYPWTLVTAAFVETNLIEFLISLFTLPLAGRYLERVWGQVEFLKFVGVTVLASNIIAVVVNVLESIVLGDKALFMYGMSYHGLMGLQVGFLVAFTQLIPEHQVQVFGGLAKVRVKSLPMLYVTVSNVACLIGYQSPYILIQFGWLASWFYLRFIKLNEGGEFRGDRSETFAFSSWFPPFAQKYVARVSLFVFNLAIRFKILKPWTDIESGSAGGFSGTPGGARAEAERRRAMALKALDQRMATSSSKPSSAAGPSSQTPSPRMATVASMAGQPVASSSGEEIELQEGDKGKGKEKE